ncbi:MAG: hypothetical protein J1E40_00900 [Oscillospiraceae bacterium]|nr:hypothetical protein [Oscillospiraceae bacterium]
MARALKILAYMIIALGILSGIFVGIVGGGGFWTFLLYAGISIISCLPWFAIVEISEKIDSLSEQLTKMERMQSRFAAGQGNNPVSNSKLQIGSAPVSPSVGSKWTCPECEQVNPSSQRTCKSCGYTR